MRAAFSIIKSIITFLFLLPFLAVNAQARNYGPPPGIKPGLEINRTLLLKKIKECDSAMILKKDDDINNLSNYTGLDSNKTYVQIIGKEDELVLAKWSFVFTADAKINKLEIMRMSYFAITLGEQECLD